MVRLLVLSILCVISTVSVEAEEAVVLIGTDGSVRFDEIKAPEVEYTDTGLVATAEAQKYPEAIKSLLAEKADFVPVGVAQLSERMTSLISFLVTKETTLVLTRQGDTLVVRPPEDEVERGFVGGSEFNPFGLFALLFLVLLVIGNMLLLRNRRSSFVDIWIVTTAFIAFTILAVFTSTIPLATATALIAFASFVVGGSSLHTGQYYLLSCVSAFSIVTAVFLVI